ncbi:MAG: hypothetical protein Q8867_11645, partial [Bacteroidota bacterium]|nr:hypothetical protein [Bacteroidota bacterium]
MLNTEYQMLGIYDPTSFHYLCSMIFPQNFEQKIGFDQIRSMISENCLSPAGQKQVNEIAFHSGKQDIVSELELTWELLKIIQFEENFPSQDYYDMTPGLTSIQVEGTYLEPEKLSLLKLSLQTILAILDFLHNRPYDT